jgi:hypothetical protein
VFGAVSLAATLVAAWSAVAAPLPQRAPPVAAIAAGPAAQQPPQPLPRQVYVWAPADWPQPARLNLTPSGPAPINPPIRLQTTPGEVTISWAAAAWLPPELPGVVPHSGAAPNPPPLRGQTIPAEVLVSWAPPAWPPAPRRVVYIPPRQAPITTRGSSQSKSRSGLRLGSATFLGIGKAQSIGRNALSAIPPVWPYPVVLQVFSGAYKMIYLYPPPLPTETPSVNLAFDISSILGINNPIISLSSQGYPVPAAINSPQSGLLQAFFVQMSVINQYPKLTIYIQTALGDRYNVIFSPPL